MIVVRFDRKLKCWKGLMVICLFLDRLLIAIFSARDIFCFDEIDAIFLIKPPSYDTQ